MLYEKIFIKIIIINEFINWIQKQTRYKQIILFKILIFILIFILIINNDIICIYMFT